MLVLIVIGVILAIVLGISYVIGFFNTKIANQVELILFAISNLNPNIKNAKQAPKKLFKLLKILIFKRRLLVNKIKMRRALKKAKQKTRSQS